MKYLFAVLLISIYCICNGQSIEGQWNTFDDETNEEKARIEIYKVGDLFFARIIESFTTEENAVCESCKGKRKGKPIIGLVIIENLKKNGKKYDGGTIMDPENGKTYKCKLELVDNNKLKVRGYLGFSLLGRTQYWIRNKNIPK